MEQTLDERPVHAERWNLGQVLLVLLFVVATIIFILPLVYMVSSAFKPTAEILRVPPTLLPQAPTLDNFRTVLQQAPYGTWYRNSMVVATAVTAMNLLTSSLGGYIFANFEF